MNDPLEEQLRSTLRQAAQQTTTTHDIGLPPPSARPSRSRRLIVTAVLTALALVGVGSFVAARNDDPQTVQAAAGDETTVPDSTGQSSQPALSFLCANVPKLMPQLPEVQSPDGPKIRQALAAAGDFCASGGTNLGGTAYGACAVDLRNLFGPLLDELAPQIDQLKAIITEFEPRIRAITDDPATKAKIEAQLAPLRERLEGWADPANRPDLSDPATRQKMVDEFKADLAPLANDAELRAKVEAIANDLKARLEGLANSPEVQALGDRLKELAQSDQVKALGDKLSECLPR